MKSIKEIIESLDVPRFLIAELANLHPSEVSLFLRDPKLNIAAKRTRIEEVVRELEGLISETMLPPGVVFDYKNTPAVRALLTQRRDRQTVSDVLSGHTPNGHTATAL